MKTAAEIAELIRENASSSPGILELSVDGVRIKIDKTALDYWERRAAREASPTGRPISFSVDLS